MLLCVTTTQASLREAAQRGIKKLFPGVMGNPCDRTGPAFRLRIPPYLSNLPPMNVSGSHANGRSGGKVIAIDGPAGSGKSTTAKLVAARLGYQYLDTGAMYRALTWYALQNGISPADGESLAEKAEQMEIRFQTTRDINKVFLDEVDVTTEIRTPPVTQHVSEVSAHKGVREAMVRKQQALGQQGSIVAEGRDTTTVVFPDADLKIFLQATVETRAERRTKDMKALGITSTVAEQVQDIKRRDHYDSNREHSPLTRAEDAHIVDTTNLTIAEQVDEIIRLLNK
jgi:cytidylate kinase